MNLQNALSTLPKPVGHTTLVSAVMTGDYSCLNPAMASEMTALREAEEHLKQAEDDQQACQSDWAYWGYMGEISYWRSVINFLKAAEITGPGSLPDIPYPKKALVVMDVCAEIEDWSEAVLKAARSEAA